MPIDINLLRPEKGGIIETVLESEKKRFRSLDTVYKTIELDKAWRQILFNLENTRKDAHTFQKQLSILHKTGKVDGKVADATGTPPLEQIQSLIEAYTKSKEGVETASLSSTQLTGLLNFLKEKIAALEVAVQTAASQRESVLKTIGNFVHPSVPVSNDEANNTVIRTWNLPKFLNPDTSLYDSNISEGFGVKKYLSHHQVMAKLGAFELKKGVEIAGHRGYFLKGCGVLLNMALLNYGMHFLVRKGYLPVHPPYFMRKEVMQEAAELQDFTETLYRIPHSVSTPVLEANGSSHSATAARISTETQESTRDDLYLIATSEQPLCALHRGEIVQDKELPMKYAGTSTCFRREAGSHGKDTWGVFRVHQFEKVEQFCLTSPEKSWEMHEEMISIAEEFYQSLEIPYRVIAIVSGALNDAAAKKYDLEAWFPGYKEFKELVSCSNCTDYQSRALDIRLGYKGTGNTEKKFVHLLNGTLVATERCMCCILENFQTDEGVVVPRVLVPYVGTEFLKFIE